MSQKSPSESQPESPNPLLPLRDFPAPEATLLVSCKFPLAHAVLGVEPSLSPDCKTHCDSPCVCCDVLNGVPLTMTSVIRYFSSTPSFSGPSGASHFPVVKGKSAEPSAPLTGCPSGLESSFPTPLAYTQSAFSLLSRLGRNVTWRSLFNFSQTEAHALL